MLEKNGNKFSSANEETHIYSKSYKSFSKRKKLQRIINTICKIAKKAEELLRKLYNLAKVSLKKVAAVTAEFLKVNMPKAKKALLSLAGICTENAKKCKTKLSHLADSARSISFDGAGKIAKGELAKVKAALQRALGRINKKYLISSASVIALAVVFNMFFSFGYGVMANGEEIAIVKSRAALNAAVEDIDAKYGDFMSGSVLDEDPALLLKIVPKNDVSSDEQLENGIKSVSSQMVECYSLKVDGDIVAGFDTEGEAERAVELFRSNFVTEEQLASGEYTYSYLNDVEYGWDYVPSGLLMDAYAASMVLDDTDVKYGTYTVKEGDTVESIVSAFGMTQREFKNLNPFVDGSLNGVKEVNIKEILPVLMVSTTQMMEYDEIIPYETERIDDSSSYEGTTKIVQEGQDGVTHVVEKVQRINGARKSYNIVSSEVVQGAVSQTVKVGTKERPSGLGSGSFVRPYYGSISSRYGSRRSGFHSGVDFCGNVGDNIVAADNGTVIFSGWSGGYGYVIKIDHNNGYVTYYAHCSKLLAKVGQTVEKGEVIAKVGSTGNSTGPHVHFEILKDGKTQNPMNYVN